MNNDNNLKDVPVAGKLWKAERRGRPAKGKTAAKQRDLLREPATKRKAAISLAKDLVEHKYHALIESSPDLVYMVGRDDIVTYVNPSGLKRLGLSAGEVVGRPRATLFAPAVAARQRKALKRVFISGKTSVSQQADGSSGSAHYQETQLIPIKSRNGETQSVLGISRDITDRKTTEYLLKKDEEMLRGIFETAKDNIFIKDLSGRYIKLNQACADVFRLTRREALGKTDVDIFPAAVAAEVFRNDRTVIRTGKPHVASYELTLPSGKYFLNTIKTPLRDAAGKITGVIGIARDVIELKKEEENLALARAAAAVGKIAKPISHDFNNALTVIKGHALLLAEGLPRSSPIKDDAVRIIKAVMRAEKHALKLQNFAYDPDLAGGKGR